MTPLSPRFRTASAIALASLALAACSRKDGVPGAGPQGAAPPPMPVTVVKVEMRKVPISLEAVGQAEGSREGLDRLPVGS